MQPNAPPIRKGFRRGRLVGIVAAIAIVGAALALAVFVWYPTTLQPNLTLADASYTATPCSPVLGGYGNRYDWTFTLINTGRADGEASVQFLLNGYSAGYQDYLVPPGSQVAGTGQVIGEVYASPAECGALDAPALSLASVTRSPAIDERTVMSSIARPLSMLAFVGVLVGALSLIAERRGISLFHDLGTMGWVVGFLVVSVASLFSSIVTQILITPYNYPLDWTPVFVYGTAYGAVGVALFAFACRELLRRAGPDVARTV